MELISVIVPVYKVEEDLEKCVRSIQRQTYTNLEIILVDDGSPDRCGAICDAMAAEDPRIKVIHKPNGGLSDARNAGMDAATGEYVAFIDSDDWIDPMMYEVLLQVCHEQHAPIAECSFRNVFSDSIQEETPCTAEISTATPLEAIESNLRWKSYKTVVWNKLYHRNVVSQIRYPKGKIHEDEYTTHKFYLAAYKIAYVDISFYNYNKKRTGSITANIRLANLDAVEAFHEKVNFVRARKDLSSLLPLMCGNYCFTFYDKMTKCIQADLKGQQLEDTIELFCSDMQWMKDLSIEAHYIDLYHKLVQQGRNECAKAWQRLIGG